MFTEPCTFKEGTAKLKLTSQNIIFYIENTKACFNGNSTMIKKLKADLRDSCTMIKSIQTRLSRISRNYGKCCNSLNNVYKSYHSASLMHDQEGEFRNIVNVYRENTVNSFTPTDTHIKAAQKLLSPQEPILKELMVNAMGNKETNYQTVLAEFAKVIEQLQTEHTAVENMDKTAVCLKSSLFEKEIREKVDLPVGCMDSCHRHLRKL